MFAGYFLDISNLDHRFPNSVSVPPIILRSIAELEKA